jgi:UDP-GlcNAc:undecaprenyl-phosphate GlcNAc-1-phosphate transferase
VASLAGAAAGAMLAFWWWNKPRARIFLGDLGALPIGALFGALAALVAIELDAQQCEQVRPWLPAVLPAMLGLPFGVDTGFVCITRAARGQNPMIGGTDHLTHRALRRGWPAAAVLVVIAVLGIAGIVLAGITVLGWG